MPLNKLFKRSLTKLYVIVFVLGLVSSLSNVGMLTIINAVISQQKPAFIVGLEPVYFLLLLTLSYGSSRALQSFLIVITNDTLLEMELAILNKLSSTSYKAFASLGKERVYTTMEDIQTLKTIPALFVNIFSSVTVILCGLIYLLCISYVGAIVLVAAMFILGTCYNLLTRRIEPLVRQLRDNKDDYYRILEDLIDGFREIKLSKDRTSNIYEAFLKQNRIEGKSLRVKMAAKYLSNELFGSYTWYILIGLALFAFPAFLQFSVPQVAEFVVTILYIMGPIVLLLEAIPSYQNAKVAMERIEQVEKIIKSTFNPENFGADAPALAMPMKQLSIRDVTYQYYDRGQAGFSMGPVSLDIAKGELIFISGSNGSGKSTFLNILGGITLPSSGEIFYNDVKIEEHMLADYRNKFIAVFSPCYLFHKNYNNFNPDEVEPVFDRYATLMGLSHIGVADYNGYRVKLSSGQRKRLALILALLEDKEIIILDEWAAEQDPAFKKNFYERIIPQLKAQGKTIIAITHDDHYYGTADRVLRFDYGKISTTQETLPVMS